MAPLVLPGVSIGTGAVVGVGAVATRDVPPFAIAVEACRAAAALPWWD